MPVSQYKYSMPGDPPRGLENRPYVNLENQDVLGDREKHKALQFNLRIRSMVHPGVAALKQFLPPFENLVQNYSSHQLKYLNKVFIAACKSKGKHSSETQRFKKYVLQMQPQEFAKPKYVLDEFGQMIPEKEHTETKSEHNIFAQDDSSFKPPPPPPVEEREEIPQNIKRKSRQTTKEVIMFFSNDTMFSDDASALRAAAFGNKIDAIEHVRKLCSKDELSDEDREELEGAKKALKDAEGVLDAELSTIDIANSSARGDIEKAKKYAEDFGKDIDHKLGHHRGHHE